MWITFSLFLQYSYVLASVQCENHSHNDKSFPVIPNMLGSIGPKWFGLQPPYNLGSVHATISDTWIIICFTIYSNTYKHLLQTASFSVFIEMFSSLITKHNWRHILHNHGRHRWKWPPSTPHEALRSTLTFWMNRLQPPKRACWKSSNLVNSNLGLHRRLSCNRFFLKKKKKKEKWAFALTLTTDNIKINKQVFLQT